MAKKIYISVIVGGIGILAFYYFVGGFKGIVVEEDGAVSYRIAGNYFYGKYDDRQVEINFVKARDLILNKTVEGELCVIAYKSDTLREEYIAQFIGVKIPNGIALPEGFEERLFTSDKCAKVTLDMHPIAMPNPEKVQDKLIEYAQSKGWTQPELFLEIYKPDNSMEVRALKD